MGEHLIPSTIIKPATFDSGINIIAEVAFIIKKKLSKKKKKKKKKKKN